jgi:hypothetical protein
MLLCFHHNVLKFETNFLVNTNNTLVCQHHITSFFLTKSIHLTPLVSFFCCCDVIYCYLFYNIQVNTTIPKLADAPSINPTVPENDVETTRR